MKCYLCKQKRKGEAHRWEDYNLPFDDPNRVKYYCSGCWNRARTMRRKGFVFSSVLRNTSIHKKVYNKVILKRRGIAARLERKELIEAVGYCENCGGVENLTVHHYKPKSLKGQDEARNYIVLCKRCHIERYHPELRKNENSPSI